MSESAKPLALVVADALRARILRGEFAPDERLQEVAVAEQMQVSRTPVREALQRLELAGLVEVSPNRYTRVSVPDERLVADTDEFVAYLMASCLQIALRRCDDAALAVTLDHVDRIIEASRADDRVALIQASLAFFQQVARAASNVAFLTLLRESEFAIRRNLTAWHPFIDCPVRRTSGYESLRAAIAMRDGDGAHQLVRELHGLA